MNEEEVQEPKAEIADLQESSQNISSHQESAEISHQESHPILITKHPITNSHSHTHPWSLDLVHEKEIVNYLDDEKEIVNYNHEKSPTRLQAAPIDQDQKKSIESQLLSYWQFAAICQFFIFFQEYFGFEDFDSLVRLLNTRNYYLIVFKQLFYIHGNCLMFTSNFYLIVFKFYTRKLKIIS